MAFALANHYFEKGSTVTSQSYCEILRDNLHPGIRTWRRGFLSSGVILFRSYLTCSTSFCCSYGRSLATNEIWNHETFSLRRRPGTAWLSSIQPIGRGTVRTAFFNWPRRERCGAWVTFSLTNYQCRFFLKA